MDDASGMPPQVATRRDGYVDLLRALSLLVVVVWHWVFSVILWRVDGPHASNPIGTTHGLWALTWVLQVMPIFFWVGGFVHLTTWESTERAGGTYGEFLRRRLGRLLGPTAVCLAAVLLLRLLTAVLIPDVEWVARGLVLMVSPLWFLGVYVVMVLLAPLAVRAHRAGGEVVLVLLAGAAILVDVLRFRYHLEHIELANLVIVWGLAHQFGFFYDRLVAAPRRAAWCLFLGGFFMLMGLTNIGLYPRSMVGVPGEAISNMGPPTLCIAALAVLQVGLALLVRPAALRWMEGDGPRRLVAWAGANAMTVFLWHLTGYAVAYGLLRLAGWHAPQSTTPGWWLQRPLWAIAPALATAPLVMFFRRFDGRGTRSA